LNKGYLDSIKVSEIKRYETELHDFVQQDEIGQKVLSDIRKTKDLPTAENLNEILDRFQSEFI